MARDLWTNKNNEIIIREDMYRPDSRSRKTYFHQAEGADQLRDQLPSHFKALENYLMNILDSSVKNIQYK